MIDFSYEKNKLLINGNVVREFKCNILNVSEISNSVIVLLDFKNYVGSDNVYCFNEDGALRWQIENRTYDVDNCPVAAIYGDTELILNRICGFNEKINLEDGKLIDTSFVK